MRFHVSSVSPRTTATNSAAGSLVGAPVGTCCVCCGATCSVISSSANGLVPVRHDTASTMSSIRCRHRQWSPFRDRAGPQCWYSDVHLPISWLKSMRELIQIADELGFPDTAEFQAGQPDSLPPKVGSRAPLRMLLTASTPCMNE